MAKGKDPGRGMTDESAERASRICIDDVATITAEIRTIIEQAYTSKDLITGVDRDVAIDSAYTSSL